MLLSEKLDCAIPRGHHLTALDAGRGVAALLVVFYHATAILALPKYYGVKPFSGFFSFGYSGVDFFFVLSGFIIFYIHRDDLGNSNKIFSFAIKRILRIYPLYWIITTIVILSMAMSKGGLLIDVVDIIFSYLLLPQRSIYPIITAAWTLVHEVFFYFMFSTLIINLQIGKVLMLGWFIGIIYGAICGVPEYLPAFIFNLHNIEFFVGMFVAHFFMSGRTLLRPVLSLILGIFIYLGIGFVDIFIVSNSANVFLVLYALSSALIIYSLVLCEINCGLIVPKWAQFIGASSYSLYLSHFIVLAIVAKFLIERNFAPSLSIYWAWIFSVVIAIFVGLLVYSFFERHMNRILRQTFL